MVKLTIEENHKVSVVIRTRDLEDELFELLKRLAGQTVKPAQIVVVDNYSCEERLKTMQSFLSEVKKQLFADETPIRLVALPDEDFSHAYSTNLGVYFADNEFVCITNGHSLPISRKWLENGLLHFKDPTVVGVSGYFLTSQKASVWERIHSLFWALPREATNVYKRDFYFSTINCILRKSIWEEYFFDEKLPELVPESRKYGGEDYDWGLEMVARNYRIVVDPKFNVYHSHGESFLPFFLKRFAYNKIKRVVKGFKRPRKSFTRVFHSKNCFYDI